MHEGLYSALSAFLIFLPFVAIQAFFYYREHKRQIGWQHFADQQGMKYTRHGNAVLAKYADLKTFRQDSRLVKLPHRLGHHIQGHYGEMEVEFLDYKRRGRRNSGINWTVCVVRHDDLALPHFVISTQSRLADALGFGELLRGQDIAFDGDEDFCKRFVVQGEREASIRRFFNSTRRSALCQQDIAYLHVEGRGDTFVFHLQKRLDATEANQLLTMSQEWLALFRDGHDDTSQPRSA